MSFKDRLLEQLNSSKDFLVHKSHEVGSASKEYAVEAVAVLKSISNLKKRTDDNG